METLKKGFNFLDQITPAGRKRVREEREGRENVAAADALRQALAPFDPLIRPLEVGQTAQLLKHEFSREYYTNAGGGYGPKDRGVSITARRGGAGESEVVAEERSSVFAHYRYSLPESGRHDDDYHTVIHAIDRVKLNSDGTVLEVATGRRTTVKDYYIARPWDTPGVFAIAEPVVTIPEQTAVLRRVTGLIEELSH